MLNFQAINEQLDLVEFCENQKIKHNHVSGDEYMIKCPAHQDRKPSFAWNNKKKVGHCFVCHFKCDGIGFVRKHYGFNSMMEAVKTLDLFVTDYLSPEVSIDKVIDNLKSAKKFKNKVLKWQGTIPEPTICNTEQVQAYRPLGAETIEKFGLVADETNKRVAIPITFKGDLVGLQWYHTQKNEEGELVLYDKKGKEKKVNKYHIEHGFQKARYLFGYDQALDSAIERDYIILVEGAFCTMAAHDKGYPNTVCSFGANLSEEQAELLLNLSRNIYLCYDNDTAGRKGAYNAMLELGVDANVKLVALPKGKDIYDLNSEELKQCIEKAV
jgi:DNA primase